MTTKQCLLLLFAFIEFATRFVESDKPTRNVLITAEEEKLRDAEGFTAIKAIHAILDDDQSGSIDRTESADFLTADLKFGGSERTKRENAFHNNDESITVDDLWETWFGSEERGWNNDQMIEWLSNHLKLPQYRNVFLEARVTGLHLPRMAVQNSSFLQNTLGIKNYVHRQKLQLKALDLVLFGFQDSSSIIKDIALGALLAMLIAVLFFFKMHRNRSKKQMEELSSVLSKLRDMESDFEGVQNKLEEESLKRNSTNDDVESIEMLRNQLRELENERRILEANGVDGLPFALQHLLRRTYESEWGYLFQQKLECLHEMREAKELVDKMRRKHTSIMNSLKLATGAASGTDDIDNKIFGLKARMEKIKLALNECTQRWAEIESHCGFSITDSFGAVQTLNASVLPLNAPPTERSRQIMPITKHFEDISKQNGSCQRIVDWSNSVQAFQTQHNASAPHLLQSMDSQQQHAPFRVNNADGVNHSLQNNFQQNDSVSLASTSLSARLQHNSKKGNKKSLAQLFRRKVSNKS